MRFSIRSIMVMSVFCANLSGLTPSSTAIEPQVGGSAKHRGRAVNPPVQTPGPVGGGGGGVHYEHRHNHVYIQPQISPHHFGALYSGPFSYGSYYGSNWYGNRSYSASIYGSGLGFHSGKFYYSNSMVGVPGYYRSYIPYSPAYVPLNSVQIDVQPPVLAPHIASKISVPDPGLAMANPVGSTTTIEGIPVQLLDAADAICVAGGFQEAAKAYAKLELRYGPSTMISGRRFVAQVAAGDFEQAMVIASIVRFNNQRLLRWELHGESLQTMGLRDATIRANSESLAALAFEDSVNVDRLFALASWLHLAEDDARAELFFARCAQMDAAETEGSKASEVPTEESHVEVLSLE